MSKNIILKSVRKFSLFILTGIIGIIAFLNTAIIEQADILQKAEIESIINGINKSTLFLLLSSIFLFVSLLPLEEIINGFKLIFKPNIEHKNYNYYLWVPFLSFLIGTIIFICVFVCYFISFILTK